MRSLFGKIFLSFWITLVLLLAISIVVTWVIRQKDEAALEITESRLFTEAIQAYEQSGDDAIRAYVDEVRESQRIRLFFFNDRGEEITGRQVPDFVKDVERGKPRPPRRDVWGIPLPGLQHQTVVSAGGHRYSMIAVGPPPGPLGFHAIWRAFLIAIISSGLVCYLLAKYLTTPVVRLRAATQKLASGDLTARAGDKGSRRRDEIAQLVRDFDAMAERLEKLINAQSRLLNDISHELRSPLARLNVGLALARKRSGPEAQSSLDRIELESERLNAMIERLLTIARLESGGEELEKTDVHLADLVQEIAEDADFEAQNRNCRVKAAVVNDPVVLGSPALLHSAIENVVRNAMRYANDGTDVEVRLEATKSAGGDQAVVRVIDSGPGVPEESLDKLFRPFYRIDDARGRQTGGVGLGLAITERAVRLHRGTVQAANRREGGLVVEIRLPLVRVETTSPDTAPVSVSEGQPT